MNRRYFLASLLTASCGGGISTDIRNTQIAHPETKFRLTVPASRSEWDIRRKRLRSQVLGAAGLLPSPARPEFPVQIRKRVLHRGFTTEALLFETLPGYFVGATLYRPSWIREQRPGVLIPHGHWERGRVEDLPSYSVPALGANLALQGYVALAWDMVGFNDSRQTRHSFGSSKREQLWSFNPLGLQLWNSIRALDYLLSRSDVDRSRVACTGASGGATQTILLTAVDDRVTCSAPVNMISAHYQGADPCEEAPNLRLGTSNVEIAALMAPRPMLVVSCTRDWTRNTPELEYPYLQRVYELCGSRDRVANAHFDAPHNYDRNSREAVYKFFAAHMLDKPDQRPHDVSVGPFRDEDLLAEHQAPEDTEAVLEAWRKMPRDTSETSLRFALQRTLNCEWPEQVTHSRLNDLTLIERPDCGEQVPYSWLPGEGAPLVVIHPKGSEAARQAFTSRDKRPVLFVDVFQTGSARGQREKGGRWYLSYNQTDDAHRVQDILTALSFAQQITGMTPELIGLEQAAIWCLFAASVAPKPVNWRSDLNGWAGMDEDFENDFFVPGIQRAGGLNAALQLIAG